MMYSVYETVNNGDTVAWERTVSGLKEYVECLVDKYGDAVSGTVIKVKHTGVYRLKLTILTGSKFIVELVPVGGE